VGGNFEQLHALVDVEGRDGLAVDEHDDRLCTSAGLRGYGKADAEDSGCGEATASICQGKGVRHRKLRSTGLSYWSGSC
jgi:hypothetical protein